MPTSEPRTSDILLRLPLVSIRITHIRPVHTPPSELHRKTDQIKDVMSAAGNTNNYSDTSEALLLLYV